MEAYCRYKERMSTKKIVTSTVTKSQATQSYTSLCIYRKKWQNSEECMCRLRNIAVRYYKESVTTGQTGRRTYRRIDRQTPDKVIPMCHYASQATQ